jgi:hypothetical protein
MRTVVAIIAALLLAPAAHAGGPTMFVGVTAEGAKQANQTLAGAEVQRAKLAGFDTIRLIQFWQPGQTEPSSTDLALLRNAVLAAQLNQMRVSISVSHPGSRTTPLTAGQRREFVQFAAAVARSLPYIRHFTVGNEPNLNRFWLPQFGPNGENVAAPAYLALLAETYDALKAVSSRITVIGGAVSPRGSDNPNLMRQTHSPTKFILDLGVAYRASGRTRPVMDAFAIHPFADNSSQSPTVPHPRGTSIGVADYTKLVSLLARAFDGTAQRGSTLPIYYNEFGVESVPPAPKEQLYTGEEPDTTQPVDEETQSKYYREAVSLAFCQPTVHGFFVFLNVDEPVRPGWQSGLYYADGEPKSSRTAMRRTARQSRGGVVARCTGMRLTPKVGQLTFARRSVSFTCDIDCRYSLRLEALPSRRAVLARTNVALAGRAIVRLPAMKLAPGRYRFVITFLAPVNTGGTVRRISAPFEVASAAVDLGASTGHFRRLTRRPPARINRAS